MSKLTKTEFTEKMKKAFLMRGDEAQLTALLTELTEEHETLFDEHSTLSTDNETMTATVQKLKNANADLYLKVSTQTVEKPVVKEEEITKIPSYDELFDEGGSLK